MKGIRIARLRKKHHFTQQELASQMNITRASLSHYETGRRQPDMQILAKLADFFDVTVDYLVGRTNQLERKLDDNVRHFVDSLELSDQRILDRFLLTVDNEPLSPEESQRFITFIRAQRMSNDD